MRIVCQQRILMKYHALFIISESSKIWNCRQLQIIGGVLWFKKGFHFRFTGLQGCHPLWLDLGSAVAQWYSAWLETERPQVRASPVSLCCGSWARHIYPNLVLVQPRKTHLSLFNWDVKNQIKQKIFNWVNVSGWKGQERQDTKLLIPNKFIIIMDNS